MHDTLANRGRVNYESYSSEEKNNIQTLTMQYLNSDIDEIS